MSTSRWEEHVQTYERRERAELEAERARRTAQDAYDAASPPDRCVGHVQGDVVDHHADGTPMYGPGHRCLRPGRPRDDRFYRCDECEARRQASITAGKAPAASLAAPGGPEGRPDGPEHR